MYLCISVGKKVPTAKWG